MLWSAGTAVFALTAAERPLLSSAVLARGKNVSFDPATGAVGGSALTGEAAGPAAQACSRGSATRRTRWWDGSCPAYRERVERGRTSFRPVEVAGRASSWRQDDTRLHIDSFPASPVRGTAHSARLRQRQPGGAPAIVADRGGLRGGGPALRAAGSGCRAPGAALLLRAFGITKSRRSAYDAMMLQLHDLMKADTAYQPAAPQTAFDFPAGSTWMAFTDQVSHAAMAGQYQLEQTFLLPVDAMRAPERVAAPDSRAAPRSGRSCNLVI